MESISDGNSAAPASTGPATFAEAFASDASSAADPSVSTTTTPAAAQPALESGATPAATDRSPFIPRARFDEVNTKYGELQRWKEQHGWAEQVNREAVAQAEQIAQRYQTDPLGYAKELLSEMVNDPTHGPALRSEFARYLGQRPQAAPPPVDLNPIPVQFDDGQTRNMLTAEQHQAALAKLREEFQPALDTATKLKQAEEAAETQRQAATLVVGAFKRMKDYPQFKENAKAISERVRTAELTSGHPAEVETVALRAYLDIVLPKLDQSAQSKLLDSLQTKAAASRSPNPGSAAPSAPADVRSFNDPRLAWK